MKLVFPFLQGQFLIRVDVVVERMAVAKLTVCAIDISQSRAVKEQYPTKALVLVKNAKTGAVLRKDEIFKL